MIETVVSLNIEKSVTRAEALGEEIEGRFRGLKSEAVAHAFSFDGLVADKPHSNSLNEKLFAALENKRDLSSSAYKFRSKDR